MRQKIKTFRKFGVTVHLFDLNKRDGYGKQVLGYELKIGREIIFEGNNFSVSPFYAIDSLNAVKSLLTFLTLQKGDTDAEYFENYTDRQLEFSQSSECENLRLYLADFD